MKIASLLMLILVALASGQAGQEAVAPKAPEQNLPSEPGLYALTDHGRFRIEGQAVTFERTGSLLISAVTVGIKAAKINVQLPGAHSSNVVSKSTEFFYRIAPEMIQQGAGIGDIVLLQMKVNGARRQVETRATGLWRSSRGVSIKIQVETARRELQPGLYTIKPTDDLKPGEYGFYLFRGNVLPPYFYDFSVPN